jgi:hypothetical protein
MTIQTIDELLDFIETNYEKLSNEKYIELLKLTIQVYVSEKPSSKEIAIKTIQSHYEYLETFPEGHELPLFM